MQETLLPQEEDDKTKSADLEQPTNKEQQESQYYGEFEELLSSAYLKESATIDQMTQKIDRLNEQLLSLGFVERISAKVGLAKEQERAITEQLKSVTGSLVTTAESEEEVQREDHGLINSEALAEQFAIQQRKRKERKARWKAKAGERKERELIDIRQRKADLMKAFHDQLRQIDQGIVPEILQQSGDRRIVYWQEITQSFYVLEKGQQKLINIGDIIADAYYGINYQADSNMPRLVWRKLTKIILIQNVKDILNHYYNRELIIRYGQIYNVSGTSDYYDIPKLTNLLLEIPETEIQKAPFFNGFIAESVVLGLLTRIAYNNPSLNIRIEPVNVLEDEALKYDLKIIFKRIRGISLNSDISREEMIEFKKTIGLQLTIQSKLHGKTITTQMGRERLDRVSTDLKNIAEEIVIVKLNFLPDLALKMRKWIREGKPSGGIDQYLSEDQMQRIVKRCLGGLVEFDINQLVI